MSGEMPTEESLRINLRNFRKEFGLTQKQVADAIGVTNSTVNSYENGHSIPNLFIIQRIARFFNTTSAALIGAPEYELRGYERVVPVSSAKEKTVREWIAKLDEQVTEFKQELLWLYQLDDEIEPVREGKASRVAIEAADIHTVIASILTRLAVNTGEQIAMQEKANFETMINDEDELVITKRSVYDLD